MSRKSNWPKRSGAMILQFALLASASFCAVLSPNGEAVCQTATAVAPHNEIADGYDPQRDPDGDLAVARAEAQRSNKNIFVVVGGEWCTWCHIMDRFFHDYPNLETLRDKNYVCMKVSMSQENPNRAFLSRFPYIHGYPHIFILNANGHLLRSQSTNELEDGKSYNAKRFRKFLVQYAPKGGQ